MLKQFFKILFILFLSAGFITAVALAQDGDDSQSGDRPPGWDKGKKEGWKSDLPPGQEENEKKKKKDRTGKDTAPEGGKLEKEKKEKGEKKQKRQKEKKKKKKAKK